MNSLHLIHNPGGIHFSESRFRKYEKWIADFVATFPSPLTITPHGSPVTFQTQIRSAINAHITKRFKSEVDPDELRTARIASVIIVKDGSVVLGPKEGIAQKYAEATLGDAPAPSQFLATVTDPSPDTLSALAYLYATGILTQPTQLLGTLPEARPDYPGYAIEQTGENVWVMM